MIPIRHSLVLLAAIICMLVLHHFFRYATASLFIAPIGIAYLLAIISPAPVILITICAIGSELLTTLPFGSMIVLFAVPFAMQWLMKYPEVDITWKFFFTTVLCVALQIIVFLVAKNGVHIPRAEEIPFAIIGLQLVCTSAATYAISIAYHEYTSRI